MPQTITPSIIRERKTALVEPADTLPMLDASVQAFLDEVESGVACLPDDGASSAMIWRTGCVPAPRGSTAPATGLLIYLTIDHGPTPQRGPALQTLANEAGICVRHIILRPEDNLQAARRYLDQALAEIAAGATRVDTDRLAIGGDGLGGAMALALVLDRFGPIRRYQLLILATPILSPPSDLPVNAWLAADQAKFLATQRTSIEPALARCNPTALPPMLILTAEADPFRDGAETQAKRLMAAGADVTALRVVGTIHDFTWLPALIGSPASTGALRIMAATIRQHLLQTAEKET